MKACDEKLKSCLMEAMRQDNARLEEEFKNCEPHVFSEEFERKMEEMLQVRKRKNKVNACIRYVAAAVVTLLLTGGILFIGSEEVNASVLGIDILEWLDKFFTVEDGDHRRKEDGVLFDESQISYLPEGFEKVAEEVTFPLVQYEYKNSNDEFIIISCFRDRSFSQIDNEEIENKVYINSSGYEYTLTKKKDGNEVSIIWVDEYDIYYNITGDAELSDLINVMNGISY